MKSITDKIIEWSLQWRLTGNTGDLRIPELHFRRFFRSLFSENEPVIQVTRNWYDKACRALLRRPNKEITKWMIGKFVEDFFEDKEYKDGFRFTYQDIQHWLDQEECQCVQVETGVIAPNGVHEVVTETCSFCISKTERIQVPVCHADYKEK